MKVSIPEDVLIQDLEDEMVLLNLQNEQYYGLDDVGTLFLNTLKQKDSVQAALEALKTEFEVEPEVLKQDLQTFIRQLADQGLLEIIEE